MNDQDFQSIGGKWEVPYIDNLFDIDPNLRDYEKDIRKRYAIFESTKHSVDEAEGLESFSLGYKEFGICVLPDGGIKCREWIPNARAVYLSGDFNNWKKWMYERRAFGKWELCVKPNEDGTCFIPHLSELKLWVETNDNRILPRISPWAKYVVKMEKDAPFKWLFWNPPKSEVVTPTNFRPAKPLRLRIYEAHIGISSNHCNISSYRHFTEDILPRIRELGYNCVLLMAIMEHPDYSSMGYSVTNYFAVSSRYGTPEDFKQLIDEAHKLGIIVMMDVAHSQASTHVDDGLNMFDGTDDCYFEKNKWSDWGYKEGKIFDLKKWEVLRFLLSNLRYYLEEYNVDGFRFNNVTSMIYHNPWENSNYSNDYRQYFGMHVNMNALSYLMLANDMIHYYYPNAVTIAEETSEMPTLCRPVREGGLGFDYKLGMSVPNKWMKLLEECKDENWNMGFLFHAMTERRKAEKVISCTETHKESMIQKKTLIHKLIGDQFRECISDLYPLVIAVDRGISLYKMIRLITHSLAGDGYLSFMGTEFGHPDFVEFPSSENNYSFLHARRHYDVGDNQELWFKYLKRFDKALNIAEEKFGWLLGSPGFVSRKHDDDKTFVYERAQLLFLFNFHPTKSFPDYKVGTNHPGIYKIVLDTDDPFYGGHGRNDALVDFPTKPESFDGRDHSLMVYLPCRCALVMAAFEHDDLSNSNDKVMPNQDVYQPPPLQCNKLPEALIGSCNLVDDRSHPEFQKKTNEFDFSTTSDAGASFYVYEEYMREQIAPHMTPVVIGSRITFDLLRFMFSSSVYY